MLTIRCSSLDRVFACAGSLGETKHPYTPNSLEAREGTAGHAALAKIVVGDEPDLDAIAREHDVDADELRKLVARGVQTWQQLKVHFPNPGAEVKVEAQITDKITLRGTADVLSLSSGSIAVLDWKAGWAPSEHTHQLEGYGYCAAAGELSGSEHVMCCEVWVRAGEIRVRKYDADDLRRFRAGLIVQVGRRGDQWGPGLDSCRYCPHQTDCESRDQWLRSSVTALEPVSAHVAITRDVIGQLYDRAKMLSKALDRYDEVLKAMLAEGPVPLPDGRRLVFEDREQDKIRPSRAMPYLREQMELTPEEADEVLSITKSGIERVIKARAPKGKGEGAIREAMRALADVGAVEKITRKVVKVTT